MNRKTTRWVEDATAKLEREKRNAKQRVTYHRKTHQTGTNGFIKEMYVLVSFSLITIIGTANFMTHQVMDHRTGEFHNPLSTVKVVVKKVETPKKEISYNYKKKVVFMDKGQKEVMAKIESTLGQAWAELIFRESGFHPFSVNSIGACGLGQALPCTKMPCELADVDCQLDWIRSYVNRRYTTIEKALAFHDENGWY